MQACNIEMKEERKTNERIFVLQLIFRSMIIFFSNEAKEMKNERQSLDPQVDDGLFPGSCCFFSLSMEAFTQEQNDFAFVSRFIKEEK